MRHHPIAVAVAALSLPALAHAQIALTPEFQVNTYTTNTQAGEAIAADGAGNFIMAWFSNTQDGSLGGVYARRYLASGVPVTGTEFRVNAYTTSDQVDVSVASDATGRVVLAWASFGQDGSAAGAFARRYDAAGLPGPEFRVNDYTGGDQQRVRVAMAADGAFVVVWESDNQTGQGLDVFARRYDASGVAQGPTEFRVNSYSTGTQSDPAVAMDAAGNFVVTWYSLPHDGSGRGVYAQRYDAGGVAQGGEFRVNAYTTGNQSYPSVAMDADGDFVVAWTSDNPYGGDQDGNGAGIIARHYNAAGAPHGNEFVVNQYTTDQQQTPSVAMDAGGGFVVVWTSNGQDGDQQGVFARAYTPSGAPQGGEFQVPSHTTDYQVVPAVAAQPGGRFVATWASYAPAGEDHFGMRARRYATDPIFADGFETADLAAWSTASTDGGDLSVSAGAALKFTSVGLQATVDDTNGLFVEDGLPDDESRYRARFYFDTNGFDPGEALNHRRTRLFIAFEEAPTRRLVAIVLRRIGGVYALMGRTRLDDDTQYDTGFTTISPGAHFVEFAWRRARGPDTNDGTFDLWIDGAPVHATTTLDNNLSAVDFVRLGAISVKVGASGTLYFDEFESRRINAIGP